MSEAKFVPKPGQTDFTDIRWCPVINCVVQFDGKILIVERSKGMRLYPEHWNGISGFLDDSRSLEEKVRDELGEELGLQPENILSIRVGEIFHQDAPEYKKTWIVHPILVEVNTNVITLDWEAERYEWIVPEEIGKYRLLPGFDKVIEKILTI